MVHNQSLSLDLLNLPNNPTARKFLELIGHYQVRYTVHNDGPRFTAPDLSEAKGNQKWDFTIHFLSNLTSNKNGDSKCDSSNPNDVWVLEGDSLKEFKVIYENQLGISLGRINKLTVVGWSNAYHYLVQGYSETAKDFSNIAYNHFLEDLTSKEEGTNTNSHNLPPLPNNPTARRFIELVEQYDLECYEWNGGYWYLGSDLCEAKNTDVKDFAKNFLGSSISENYLKLEGEDLKTFKKFLPQEKYEKVKFAPSLYLADWNTAYHYLVQGHSNTAKDFSKLGSESVAESFNEENQNQYKLPQNYLEALEALVASEKQKKLAEEEKQLAEEKLGEAQAEDTLYTYRVIVSPESCLDEAEDTLDAYRAILSPEACLDFKQVADGLQIPGLGRTNLFKYLRQKNFIVQNGRVPLHRRIEEKLAVVETTSISIKTKFTFKGLEWLIKKLIEDGYQVHQTAREIWDRYH